MKSRLCLVAMLAVAPMLAFAQSATRVTLQPGENVVNLTLASAGTTATKTEKAVPTIAAPRATCSAYRAQNPVSELTQKYCGSVSRKR